MKNETHDWQFNETHEDGHTRMSSPTGLKVSLTSPSIIGFVLDSDFYGAMFSSVSC